MPDVSGNTLVVLVQSLNQSISDLIAAREGADIEERADLDEIILSYQKAQLELKSAYAAARQENPSLPQYGWLVQGDG